MSCCLTLIRKNVLFIAEAANYNVNLCLTRSSSTSITRIRRRIYPRMYKVNVINPDGSSYTVRHPEPIGVIRMPLDPNTLTDEEKKARMKRLKGDQNVDKSADFEQDDVKFDQRAVTRLLRRKKK